MKIFALALLCFLSVAQCYGQTATNTYGRIDVEIIKEKKPRKIYTKVEIKSAFPGGDSSWERSLEKTLDQSIKVDKRVKKGVYVVSLQFIVAKDSSLAEIRCLKAPGFGIAEQVMAVLKKRTIWIPGPARVRPYRTSAITN